MKCSHVHIYLFLWRFTRFDDKSGMKLRVDGELTSTRNESDAMRQTKRNGRNETDYKWKWKKRFWFFEKCLSHWVPDFSFLFFFSFFSLFFFAGRFKIHSGNTERGQNEVSLLTLRVYVCVQSSVYALKILEYALLVDKRQENCSARVRL